MPLHRFTDAVAMLVHYAGACSGKGKKTPFDCPLLQSHLGPRFPSRFSNRPSRYWAVGAGRDRDLESALCRLS